MPLVDMSYILYRNAYAASAGKNAGDYTSGDIIRITIQTLNKVSRDYGITADKFIFIYDKWDKNLGGYYRTYLLKGLYKDDRKVNYITRHDIEAMKLDPNVTEKQLSDAEKKVYFNEVCRDAKKTMIRELRNFGLPSVGIEGWEADDLIWLSSGLLYDDSGNQNIKSNVIITKDSDIQYSLTPQMDYFRIPTSGSIPEVITYDTMYNTIPDSLKGKLSLYKYRAYLESLGDGHNNMRKTKKTGANSEAAILHILDGDYSDIEDIEGFKTHLRTFNIGEFPRLEEAKKAVLEQFSTIGKLGSQEEFHTFCSTYGVDGISDRYFTEFISRFDPRLYSEK
jgi:hypothetical protein